MRRILLTALLLVTAAAAGGAADPARADDGLSTRVLYEDGHEDRLLVGGRWLFRQDAEDQGLVQRFQDQVTEDGWSPVSVPSAWNAGDDSAESQRGSVGWYRKDFRLPRSARSGSHVLRFEAVNYRATVWLNGRELGRHEGGYTPFEVRADGLSRTGLNRLVVRVDNRRSDTDVPPLKDSDVTGLPGGGWWNYGGLIREVYLRRYERVDIEEVLVRPEIACRRCAARVLVSARLRNDRGGRRRVRFTARFGGVQESRSVMLPSGRAREVSVRMTVRRPRLWEPASPSLYDVRATVSQGRSTLAGWRGHAGVRRIEVDRRGRVLLNGRRVVFRGASIHEDHPVIGAALSDRKRKQIFARLLQLNANITRAHYPLHPRFVELADRYGVMLWNQVPVYRMREETIALRSVRAKSLDYLEAMVRRDRNHASVLTWSVANELSRNVRRGQAAYLRDARRLVGRLDPTRLTAIDIAGYPSVRLVREYRRFDALGANSYFGWYPGPIGSVLNREVLGPYLDQLHEYYGRQALFVTEFGAEANRDGPVDEKGTYAFQQDLMRYHLSVYDRKRYLNGAIAWLLQDFKVRPGWDGYNRHPSPPYNKKGLIDEYFRPKPAFDESARAYSRALRGRGARRGR